MIKLNLTELERKAWIEGDKEKSELYEDIIGLLKEAEERDDEIEALKDRVNALEQLLEDIGGIVRKYLMEGY
jgi:hypothetical protein